MRSNVLSSNVAPRVAHETLLDALEAAAAADGPYATFHGAGGARGLTYRGALDGARAWAALLARRGLRRGERVAILLPTGPAFVTALLGALLAGGVPVPLAAPLTFGNLDKYLANLARVVRHADARFLLTYPRVRDAGAPLPAEETLTEAALDGVGPRLAPYPSLGARDTALLQYTSGTTGDPKGAVISHRALMSNAFAIAHALALRERDVGVSWLPLFHDMGLIGVLLTAIAHPYAIHVMSPEAFVMRPMRWLETMAKVGGTISCAPNFGYELAAAKADAYDGGALSGVRAMLDGAEPVLAPTVARFAARFARHGLARDVVLPVYGMAENTLAATFPALRAPLAFARPADDAHATSGRDAVSVGAPVAGVSIAIAGEDGAPLGEGMTGEIRVAGSSLMDGYFRNERASAAALDGGWLRTGDLGFVAGGQLFVSGRVKDVIIQAGRNVHAVDVERIAREACGPRAGAVAAFACPSDARGTDDLVVLVETTEASEEKRAKMAGAVRGEVLAAMGVRVDDVRFAPVGSAPRTTSGKIRRRECARLAKEARS